MNGDDEKDGDLTMLAGGKVLFDETAGLQPVNLVEVPAAPKALSHGRRRPRAR